MNIDELRQENNEIVFGTKWFEKHQSKLLWLLNTPIIKHWFRWVMRIRKFDCDINKDISKITPNSYSTQSDNLITTDFRSHDKFSKRLYFAFKPFWYLLHAIDWVAFDRYEELAKLSFGFSTLTVYPTPGSTVDGFVKRTTSGDGNTWSDIRTGAGTTADYTSTVDSFCEIRGGFNANTWDHIQRGIFTFDTSSLTSAATISATVLSLNMNAVTNQSNAGTEGKIDIYTSTPSSNTTLSTSDYGQVGTTSQTGSGISYSSIALTNVYNDFTFNATGRGNVSKTGVSKFGAREAIYDVTGTQPTYNQSFYIQFYGWFSDETGTTSDPKLVVTYSTESAPTVTTQAVTDITGTTATGNGNVTADGGATVTERGICWKTSTGPTTADSKATASGTTGAFTANITGLTSLVTYYVRAYAINSVGTSYGSEVTFTAKLSKKTGYRVRAYATNSAGTSYGDTVQVTTADESNASLMLLLIKK